MLSFTLATGLVPAFLLTVFRSWRDFPSLFLTFLLLSLCAYSAYWNSQLWSFPTLGSLARALNGSAIYFAGPALYGYVSALNREYPGFSRWWPHLLPLLFYLSLTLAPAHALIGGILSADHFLPGIFWVKIWSSLALHGLSALFGPFHLLCYVLWSCSKTWQYENGYRTTRITWPETLQTLLCLFAAISIALAIQSAMLQQQPLSGPPIGLLPYFFNIAFAGIALSVFCFPEVLYGAILPPEYRDAPSAKKDKKEYLFKKGYLLNIEEDYLQQLENKIEWFMLQEQPYLDHDLNLTRFSVLTGIPVHHLSHYFRNTQKLTFTAYRNLWRVRHAKKMILQGDANVMTLEAIGEKCGFSSRNAFLQAFKKFENVAPREFMLQNGLTEEKIMLYPPIRPTKIRSLQSLGLS